MEQFFFWFLAVVAIGGALMTVGRKNPLACALSLVVSFAALAGLYFMNDAPFVGVLQILVYAGAVMVLVIFVIMLLNLPEMDLEDERISKQGLLVSVFLLLPLTILCIGVFAGLDLPPARDLPADFGSVGAVGDLLFAEYLLQFEVISLVLLVAIVGAVMLAKKRI